MFRCVQEIFQLLKEIISQNLTLILGIQSKAIDQVSQYKPHIPICFKQAPSLCRFLPLSSQAGKRGNNLGLSVRLFRYGLQHGFS